MFKILTLVLWIGTYAFLHSPELFHPPVVLLFQRKQTLVIKPDEGELLQPHFLFVGYYSFIVGKKKHFQNMVSDIYCKSWRLTNSALEIL